MQPHVSRLYLLRHSVLLHEAVDAGTLAQVACEMRMHSAWKADFDALQVSNTKLDSDVLSNMGSHLCYLQECKVLPEATLDQISECFTCPKKKVSQARLMAALCLMQVNSVMLQDYPLRLPVALPRI